MKITVSTAPGVTRFRRAGIEFGRDPVELNPKKLGEDVLAAILAEPRLIVTEVEDKKGDDKKGDDKKAKA